MPRSGQGFYDRAFAGRVTPGACVGYHWMDYRHLPSPDFSRLDYSKSLITNTSVPLGELFGGAWCLQYAAFLFVPLLAACLISWRKEFH